MQTEPIIRFDVSVDTARRFELVFNTTTHPSRVGRGVCGAEAQGRFGILQNYSRPSRCSRLVNFVENLNPAVTSSHVRAMRSMLTSTAGRGSPSCSLGSEQNMLRRVRFSRRQSSLPASISTEKVKAPFGAKLFRWRWGESYSRAVGYERSVYDA